MTTPYRNDIAALRERKEALEAELARLRAETRTLEDLKAREASVAGELSDIDARLNAPANKRSLPTLDDVRVASPCGANWDDMVGDDRVRFCLSCDKNVYNLSAMTREAAEALLADRVGNETCVRFYRRADGTMMTQDCPVGERKKRRKKYVLAVAGAGMLAAVASTMFVRKTCTTMGAVQGELVGVEMGDVAAPTVMGSVAAPIEPAPAPVPSPNTVTLGRMPIRR